MELQNQVKKHMKTSISNNWGLFKANVLKAWTLSQNVNIK